MKSFLLVFTNIVLLGCSHYKPPSLDYNEMMVYYYKPQSQKIYEAQSVNDQELAVRLDTIINDKTYNWSVSYITYAPHILFVGSNYLLNVTERDVILNYTDKSQPQLIKDVSPKNYIDLLNYLEQNYMEK